MDKNKPVNTSSSTIENILPTSNEDEMKKLMKDMKFCLKNITKKEGKKII
jgi:hypothetical protein